MLYMEEAAPDNYNPFDQQLIKKTKTNTIPTYLLLVNKGEEFGTQGTQETGTTLSNSLVAGFLNKGRSSFVYF